jgi:hypothetical protein
VCTQQATDNICFSKNFKNGGVSESTPLYFIFIPHIVIVIDIDIEHSPMSTTRTCEYCGSIGLPDGNGGTKKLRKCGRCYRVRYCNRDHQKADHLRHKPNCLAFVDAKQEKCDKKAQSKAAAAVNEGETKTPPPKVKATADDSKHLWNACLGGRLDEVRSLLDLDGIQINDDQYGCAPLYAASQNGNVAIVKRLIKAGGNVNQALTTTGSSPLGIASEKGFVDLVKVLLSITKSRC